MFPVGNTDMPQLHPFACAKARFHRALIWSEMARRAPIHRGGIRYITSEGAAAFANARRRQVSSVGSLGFTRARRGGPVVGWLSLK